MTARLIGGLFDGDQGELIIDPAPPDVWVERCQGEDCSYIACAQTETHW